MMSVSPHTTSILSIGMPVCSDAIIDHAVTCPWPCGEVPVYTIARPSGSTSMRASSWLVPPLVISTYTLTPMPS